MNIQLNRKRALVTGGNSGIGAAIVEALAEAGASVAINYVAHPETALELVKRIHETGGRALAIEADVSDANAVAAIFKQLDDAWGGIDILVNSAGIYGPRALAWDSEIAAWQKVIEVNLLGAYICARQALRRMVRRKSGVILNISSVHEIIAWAGYSAYTASKAGLGMMTQNLAQEAAPYGVRVLALGTGAVQTPINQAVWSDHANFEDLLQKIPLNRMGTADEIARMAVVLVSDVASYVTGHMVLVDGGMTDYPAFAHGG